ncbi:uncharacterized protein LOC100834456 isoform X1 [Brachypodium distachyon]|uniref:Ribosome-recycling factor, chloroplastic n=1 Tax=Brachypodium distachyon TaxID=15368 RepID=I1IZ46_BRADI|nr:uncharacterized protein LOC100834456 isoform X1 [Brachypodium distachyon]KQJ83288.1 hypothetical protein BRADI_5g14150v3 [Brachypodium distachyon]|eukprot:XP_003580027.1 uncharacterized protein LOC100834456 isoform X1 [Brachypodium distachyon]
MALLWRGAALAARSLRAAVAASPASTSVHCLPAAGSLGAARELPSTQLFLFETRRGFAKGKKSSKLRKPPSSTHVTPDVVENDSRGDSVKAVPDFKAIMTAHMKTICMMLSHMLSNLPTGRASIDMLNHMMVETADVKVKLIRMALVTVLDAHTLSVIPYDTSTMYSIENAIASSPLGINPRRAGNWIMARHRIIVAIPPLTKENTQALCKVVTTAAEDFKQKIREARQMALDAINKSSSSMPKDDIKRLEKEVEEITKKFIKMTDVMCKAKEEKISGN